MGDDLLLIRRNGNRVEVVPLDDAVAWPAETQRQLDACLDALGAPPHDSGDTTTAAEPT